MRLFSLDSPLMQFLETIANLMILNFLVIICCIPVFTAGAAITAAHYVSLKMARNEETYIVKNFFKSFKENFKQATIIWIVLLLIVALLVWDFWALAEVSLAYGKILRTALIVVTVIIVMISMYLFPSLAKFDNTIRATIKNALFMSISQLPKTILMVILYVLPIIIGLLFLQILPAVIMLGVSFPIYMSALLYNKFFKKIEDSILDAQIEEKEDDPDRIFSDKLDEALIESNMDQQSNEM